MGKKRKLSLGVALIPILFMVGMVLLSIKVLGQGVHVPLLLSTIVAVLVGLYAGFEWDEMEEFMIDSIRSAMQPILILMVVGMLIGTWILAGIVPTMIVYGLQIISPKIFLVATAVVCGIVSTATGSSWTTAGTVGIAFIGIGQSMNMPLPMVAGAIISGAYLGDKMSPLSDTTNLAPAMAGSNIFDHIRHMMWTTVPSFIISLILYGILGMKYSSNTVDPTQIKLILGALSSSFVISPWLLIPPLFVIIMVIKRVPAIPGLIGGVFIAAAMAMIMQGSNLGLVFQAIYKGFHSDTGIATVDTLLSRGGLMDMWFTISLVMLALSFGGVLDRTGVLEVLVQRIIGVAKSTGSLICATILTCIATNIFVGSQYMSIVIPGRMFKKVYQERGLHPKNLSRCLEDAGTLSGCLVPWSGEGAFMGMTLGVSPVAYAPYVFLSIINPIISIIYGFTGFTIAKIDPDESGDNEHIVQRA